MNAQLPLFPTRDTSRRARKNGTDTEHAARDGVNVETEIIYVFASGVALTDEQLVAQLPSRYGPTVRTARSRLSAAGYLIDTGLRVDSARGRPQIVWAPRVSTFARTETVETGGKL